MRGILLNNYMSTVLLKFAIEQFQSMNRNATWDFPKLDAYKTYNSIIEILYSNLHRIT